VIFEIPAHFAAPSSSGERPSFYQCKAAVTCGAFSFPSPALCAAIAASRVAEPMTACVSASTAHFKFAERSVGPLNLVQF
jgi:hypothetical protein